MASFNEIKNIQNKLKWLKNVLIEIQSDEEDVLDYLEDLKLSLKEMEKTISHQIEELEEIDGNTIDLTNEDDELDQDADTDREEF